MTQRLDRASRRKKAGNVQMRFASAVAIAAEPDALNVEFGYHPVLSMTISSSCPSSAAPEAPAKPAPARSRRTIAGVAQVGPSDPTE